MTKNTRLYISDAFPADASHLGVRHRSVIAAIICDGVPTDQALDEHATAAGAALGTPILHSGFALVGPDSETEGRASLNVSSPDVKLLPRHAQWRQVEIAQWDAVHGPHTIDLVDLPAHDETVLLVRVCGISPLGRTR